MINLQLKNNNIKSLINRSLSTSGMQLYSKNEILKYFKTAIKYKSDTSHTSLIDALNFDLYIVANYYYPKNPEFYDPITNLKSYLDDVFDMSGTESDANILVCAQNGNFKRFYTYDQFKNQKQRKLKITYVFIPINVTL